jgi:hypothetical protein
MTALERSAIRDLQARLRLAEERIRYLERDKQIALGRAREARNAARFWHGVALAHGCRNRRFERAA